MVALVGTAPVAFESRMLQAPLAINSPDAHVWLVQLDIPTPPLSQYQHWLSSAEHARMDCLGSIHEQQHYYKARVALRAILGYYCAIHPSQLRFAANAFGKPFLIHAPTIHFNLSHSAGVLLCAVAQNHEIGVDLEWIDPATPVDALAATFFSAKEQALLQALPDSQRMALFFRYWVAKEALLKASGYGLSVALNTIELAGSDRDSIHTLCNASGQQQQWFCCELQSPPDFYAALAMEGTQCRVQQYTWEWQQLATWL